MMSQFILSGFTDEASNELEGQLEVLASHDMKYMEMRGVNNKNVADLTLEEAKAVKSELDARCIRLSAIGSPLGKIKITDDFEPHLALFKHVLALAKIFETTYIRMFSFFIPEGEEADQYKDEVIARWQAFLDAAKGTDIVLLHENEKDIYGDTAERCYTLVKALNNDQFKLIFDFANFVQCDVDTLQAYALLRDDVAYFHIKDALYEGHKVVPAGYGDGQVEVILREAKKRGFQGFLSLEPHLGNFKGFAELENSQVEEAMDESGPGKFGVAVTALKELLERV